METTDNKKEFKEILTYALSAAVFISVSYVYLNILLPWISFLIVFDDKNFIQKLEYLIKYPDGAAEEGFILLLFFAVWSRGILIFLIMLSFIPCAIYSHRISQKIINKFIKE